MKHYCLGFVFNRDPTSVLMIKKKRSLYTGRWNGVGGEIEHGETPTQAMRRECNEESGLDIQAWFHVAELKSFDGSWRVEVLSSVTDHLHKVETKTDEGIGIFLVEGLCDRDDFAPHVLALAHHARDFINDKSPFLYLQEKGI